MTLLEVRYQDEKQKIATFARRKMHKVAQSGTAPIAEAGLKQIAALYRIEKDIRGLTSEA